MSGWLRLCPQSHGGAVILGGSLPIHTGALVSWPSPREGSSFKFCLVVLHLCSQTHGGYQGVTQTHGQAPVPWHRMGSPMAPAPTGQALSRTATSSPGSPRSSPRPPHLPRVFPGGTSGQMSGGPLLHPRQSPSHPAEQSEGPRALPAVQASRALAVDTTPPPASTARKEACPSQSLHTETSGRRPALLHSSSVHCGVAPRNCEALVWPWKAGSPGGRPR